MDFQCVVLAAGQGTRMKSKTPKVLHELAGCPLVAYPVRAALGAGASRVSVVCSPNHITQVAERLGREVSDPRVEYLVQSEPRGTGDAARSGLRDGGAGHTLIMCGDTPLVESADLLPLGLTDPSSVDELRVMSCLLDEPAGYGRIVRDEAGHLVRIVEHRDASTSEREIREVNSGIYFGPTAGLREALAELQPNNAQGELYLTDVVRWFARAGLARVVVGVTEALVGVNDQQDLEAAEHMLLERIRRRSVPTV